MIKNHQQNRNLSTIYIRTEARSASSTKLKSTFERYIW